MILLNSLRYHIIDYKLFYAIATIFLGPLWENLKIAGLLWVGKSSLYWWFYGIDMAVILTIFAVILKNSKHSWIVVLSKLIFIITLIVQIILIIFLSNYINSSYFVFFIFMTSLVIYIFWVIIYFSVIGLKDKALTKIGVIFFISMSTVFYLSKYLPIFLTEYQTYIIPSKSEILMNIWTPIITSILIISVVFLIFLIIYTFTKDKLYRAG